MTRFEAVRSEEQIAEVVRLAREIWRDHYVPIIGPAQVDYMLDKFQSMEAIVGQLRESYEYWTVLHNDRSAGYVAVVPNRNEPSLLLSKIYVRKAERGHGLGRETLRFVEALCLQRGIGMIWLTVNKNNARSIDWYSRMGFRNAGPTVQDIGGGFQMDDFRMEKTIGRERVEP